MTTEQALQLSQRVHPTDLVARLVYMQARWDACDADDMAAWCEAIELDAQRSLDRESFPNVARDRAIVQTYLALRCRAGASLDEAVAEAARVGGVDEATIRACIGAPS